MKKFISFMAVILSLLLAAAPAFAAAADDMDVLAIQFNDPVIITEDNPMVNLSGVTLQVTSASTEDHSLVQLFMELINGGKSLNSGVLQLDSNGLAGYIGGMTQAYGIKSDILHMLGAEMIECIEKAAGAVNAQGGAASGNTGSSEDSAVFTDGAASDETAASEGSDISEETAASAGSDVSEETTASADSAMFGDWVLPGQIQDTINAYISTNSVETEPYVRDVELSSGTAALEFSASTVDCNALVPVLTAMLDSDPTAVQMLESMKSSMRVEKNSFAEVIPEGVFDFTLTLGKASGENYVCEDIAFRVDDRDIPVNYVISSLSETTGEGRNVGYSFTAYPESEEFAGEKIYITFDAITSEDGVSFTGHRGSVLSGEFYDMSLMGTYSDGNFSAALSDTNGTINAFCTFSPGSFMLNYVNDGEPFNFRANWTEGSFVVNSTSPDGSSTDISFVREDNPAYLLKGQLSINVNDGTEEVGIRTGVAVLSGSKSSSASYIQPGAVVDMTPMTEEETDGVYQEVNEVLNATFQSLVDQIPGLAAIIENFN